MKVKVLVPCVLALLTAGGVAFLLLPRKAEATRSDKTVKDLVEFIKGNNPANRKLCAIDALRLKTSSNVEAELGKLAKATNGMVAIACTTALGRKGSSAAKKELKGIVEDSKVVTSVRIGALSGIACGWKDSGDISYLESKSKKDSKLASHLSWLKKHIYGK